MPIRRSLRVRLLLAHLIVIVVGVVTLLLASLAVGPTLFNRIMDTMMGPGMMNNGMMGSMTTAMAQTTDQAFRTAMLEALLWSASAATLVAVAVSLLVSQRILTPLHQLVAASRRLADGHYAERVPVGNDGELSTLAVQFNSMAAELEAAERRRVELIGNVAHELRTPLATIEGYTEGLLDGVVEPTAATWALLHDETGRLRRLVQDLQELSRAEAHQLPLHPQPVAPSALATQAIARIAAQFASKGVQLVAAVPARLPSVQADSDRITQVLMNLLGNALRSTPPNGTVTIAAARTNEDVTFSIADTGAGIAPEHLPHLFERFYRVDTARSRMLGGSGIGLTIAQALVEAHGGRIWAESPGLGQGATFFFTLPVAGETHVQ